MAFGEWIGANAGVLGGGLVGLASLFGMAWQWLQKNRAEKANVSANVAVAQSTQAVYDQMKERLTDLAGQVDRCNARIDDLLEQVRTRDAQIASMRLHIQALEHTLQLHGIEPPKMEA